jgi:exoribonuclease-2
VIRPVLQLRSRMLVKEAMLMAGEAAARFALQRRLVFPFTIQEAPDASVLQELLNRLPGGHRTSAGLAEGGDLALAFAMRRAQKRSQTGGQASAHTGLGLPVYARATSPLRRYPDLMAHQQLRAALRGGPALEMTTLLENLGEAEAATNAIAQAENLALRHWTLVYLLQHPGWHGEGVLVDKRGPRGKVIIPELALEAQVQLRQDLPLNSRASLALKGVNLAELEVYF